MKRHINSLKSWLYSLIRENMDDQQVRELHLEIVTALKNILSKTNIKNANNISDIAYIKAYAYHTNIDRAARQIFCLTEIIKRVPYIKERFAQKLASYLVKHNIKTLTDSISSKKLEDLDFSDVSHFRELPNKKVDIIFVASMTSYLLTVINLAPRLGKEYAIFTTSNAASNLSSKLLNKNVYIVDEYLSDDLWREFENTQKKASFFFHENLDSIEKNLNIRGINFYEMYQNVLINIWKYVIPQSELYYQFMDNAFKEMRPKHVIGVRVRRLFERASFVAAKANNIDTNIILHDVLGCTVDDYYQTGHFDLFDNVFVWGEIHKKMIQSDILSSKSNVHVVGTMNFTRQHATKVSMDINKNLHLMYAATRNDLRVVDQLIRAAKKIGGISITIKSHPNKDGTIYDKYSSLAFVTVIKKKIPIQEMMSKVDIFATTYSSSHIYAAMCGIPILLLAFDPVVENNLKKIFGLSRHKDKDIVITDKKQLFQVVREFQMNKKNNRKNIMTQQDEYINNLIYLRDREEDVITDILNVLNSKKIA